MPRPRVDLNIRHDQLFISNEFCDALDRRVFDTWNPATGTILATIQEGNARDIDKAVQAAKRSIAFHTRYRRSDATERASLLFRLASLMEKHLDTLASLEAKDSGKPFSLVYNCDLPAAINTLRFYAGAADKVGGSVLPADGRNFAYTRYEPVGVVGAILPWNYPIQSFCAKLAPAIAMGNALVIKPSENAPLSALYLAYLIKKVGFPSGVVNVVPGLGPVAGHALVQHPDVDMISFTGSTLTGKIIQREASKTLKRVSLELGGKSPLIVFEDAHLDKAVEVAHSMCMMNQGQCGAAATRTFVHEDIYDEFVKRTVARCRMNVIGDPIEQTTNHGPQISEMHVSKILDLIQSGIREGAKLECGGRRIDRPGYYVEPTVFSDVTDDMRIAKEEIFGPVQQIFKFKWKHEVIERCNNSPYGFSAGVFTNYLNAALEVSARLQAGTVYVNQYRIGGVQVPVGGFKHSGMHRENGLDGLRQYYEIKSVVVDLPIKL